MTSSDIKDQFLRARAEKEVVCFEVDFLHKPDIATVDRGLLLREYEIKVSRQDLRRELNVIESVLADQGHEWFNDEVDYWVMKGKPEFEEWREWRRKTTTNKYEKHRHYLLGETRSPSYSRRVNYFYFLISQELYKGEKERIDRLPYGVACIDGFYSLKKARKLCDDRSSASLLWQIAHSLTYRIIKEVKNEI